MMGSDRNALELHESFGRRANSVANAYRVEKEAWLYKRILDFSALTVLAGAPPAASHGEARTTNAAAPPPAAASACKARSIQRIVSRRELLRRSPRAVVRGIPVISCQGHDPARSNASRGSTRLISQRCQATQRLSIRWRGHAAQIGSAIPRAQFAS